MLFFRRDGKNAREKSGPFQVLGRRRAIIGNRPAHFEATGNFLRVIAFDAAAGGKIGRAAENEIAARG